MAGDIAMVESELSLRKATNASARDRIEASKGVVKAKAYELAVNNALIKSEKGVEVGTEAVAAQAAAFARVSASTSHSTAELETALTNMRQRLADLDAQIKALDNIDIEALLKKAAAAASKGGKSAKSAGAKEVLQTEYDLMEVLPENRWSEAHHSLIFHGRNCCTARNPKCEQCTINSLCRKVGI